MYLASHHFLEFLNEHVCIILSKDFEREGLYSWSSMIVAKTLNYELDWNIQNFKSSFPAQKMVTLKYFLTWFWLWQNLRNMLTVINRRRQLKSPRSFEVIERVREYFIFWILKWLNVSINELKLRNFWVLPYELSRTRPKLVFIQLNAWKHIITVNLLRQVTQHLEEILE